MLRRALQELHAATLCLGAAKVTNYRKNGRIYVARARRRLTKASKAYYALVTGLPVPVRNLANPRKGPASDRSKCRAKGKSSS